jgi:hypothetical protein
MGTMNKKGDAAEKGGTQLIGKEEKEWWEEEYQRCLNETFNWTSSIDLKEKTN